MKKGSVSWFSARKGYGFIVGDDGEDYFVHHSNLLGVRKLEPNDKVSFNCEKGEKGTRAIDVSKIT